MFIKKQSNRQSLREEILTLSQAQQAKVIQNLNMVILERHAEIEANDSARQERRLKIQRILAMIKNDNLDVESVVAEMLASATPASAKTLSPARYIYIDKNGQEKTWSGRGRTPDVIRQAIETYDLSLDAFLITPTDSDPV